MRKRGLSTSSRIGTAMIVAGVCLAAVALLLLGLDVTREARYRGLSQGSASQQAPDWAALRQQNADCAAWVQVDGTSVDYPVVAPADGSMRRYLDRDFWGAPSSAGCPFLDHRALASGPNSVVYGHHMGGLGTMFSDLFDCYRQDRFDTLGDCHWSTPEGGVETLRPVCALSVMENYADIQRFGFTGVDDMHDWERSILSQATARSGDAEDLIRTSGHVVTLVTCSSIWANQPYRCLVLFAD